MFRMREVPIRSYQSENLMMGGSTKPFPLRSVHFIKSEELLPEKWSNKMTGHLNLLNALNSIEFIEYVMLKLGFSLLRFNLVITHKFWKKHCPLAALRPDILKISAALAAIDHRLANLGRYHRRWPWGTTSLSEMLLMLWPIVFKIRHVWSISYVYLLCDLTIKAVFTLKHHL